MDSKELFKDVNIYSINFINNKNDIKIDFIDSLFNSGKFCGSLVCLDIKMFNMVTSEDDDLRFPQVICDVYTIKKNEKIYVNLMGGNYEIKIICTDIRLTKQEQNQL